MMRIVDIMYALPFTILVILLLMLFFGRHFWLLFMAIGAVERLTMVWIVCVQKMEFIEAARSLRLGKCQISFWHRIPNVLGPIIIYTMLVILAVMLLEPASSLFHKSNE
jgi:oligopeptide transport system permease protein